MRNLAVSLVATHATFEMTGCESPPPNRQSLVMPIWDRRPFTWPTPPDAMWLLILVNLVALYVRASHNMPGASTDVDPPVKAFPSSTRHPRG